MVAEDDQTSRNILVAVLRKWGFEPLAVADGSEAWRIMQGDDPPDLAILDWEMPGLDGLDVCRRIRASLTNNPPYIIILTARKEKDDIVLGLDAGANDYISKPYNSDELLARIKVGQRMVELQTELLAARNALAHEARHDPLTGIFNRRAIIENFQREIKRFERQKGNLGVGLLDIDHFKRVNDKYGHQVGDEVLCGVVQAIKGCLRGYDFLGRYGGEEFLVVAVDDATPNGLGLFERLRARVAELGIPTKAGEVNVTISIGVTWAQKGMHIDDFLCQADEALYRAKAEGRNRVCCAPGDVQASRKAGGVGF